MSWAFNIPFLVKIAEGVDMETIKAPTSMYTDGEVYAWLSSLGYSPTGSELFFRKTPYKKNKNNVWNYLCHVIFPNLNGTGNWGVLRANGTLQSPQSTVYINAGGTSTNVQVLAGDEYYVFVPELSEERVN